MYCEHKQNNKLKQRKGFILKWYKNPKRTKWI